MKQFDIENGVLAKCLDENIQEAVIPEGVTCICDGAFKNCSKLVTVLIPESVRDIDDLAFYNCINLTSVVIPKGVTNIGDFVFDGCNNLTSVVIPEGVTSIGYDSFRYCMRLTSVVIPESVTSIGHFAFYGCDSLTSITIPKCVTSIGKEAFFGCRSLRKKNNTNIYYKAFNPDMTCRGFQYEVGKSYHMDGEIKCCECGFHSCGEIIDIFNYYSGEFGKDLVICEVEIDGKIDRESGDSKVASSYIKVLRRLDNKEIIELINKGKKQIHYGRK